MANSIQDGLIKKRFNNFSAISNNLAILWGVTDLSQSRKIQKKISQHNLDRVPLIDTNEKIPQHMITPGITLIGIYKYHEHAWLWGGCLDIVSKKKQR